MIYVYLLAASIGLFLGFFGLTTVEGRAGTRVLAGPRDRFDHFAARVQLIIRHVNWSDFLAHLVRSFAARTAHDIAHFTLLIVRFIERQLTRIVRSLRDRKPNVLAPRPSRRPILEQTASYMNDIVRRARHRSEPEQAQE